MLGFDAHTYIKEPQAIQDDIQSVITTAWQAA